MIGLTGVRSSAKREETCGSLHIGCFSSWIALRAHWMWLQELDRLV